MRESGEASNDRAGDTAGGCGAAEHDACRDDGRVAVGDPEVRHVEGGGDGDAGREPPSLPLVLLPLLLLLLLAASCADAAKLMALYMTDAASLTSTVVASDPIAGSGGHRLGSTCMAVKPRARRNWASSYPAHVASTGMSSSSRSRPRSAVLSRSGGRSGVRGQHEDDDCDGRGDAHRERPPVLLLPLLLLDRSVVGMMMGGVAVPARDRFRGWRRKMGGGDAVGERAGPMLPMLSRRVGRVMMGLSPGRGRVMNGRWHRLGTVGADSDVSSLGWCGIIAFYWLSWICSLVRAVRRLQYLPKVEVVLLGLSAVVGALRRSPPGGGDSSSTACRISFILGHHTTDSAKCMAPPSYLPWASRDCSMAVAPSWLWRGAARSDSWSSDMVRSKALRTTIVSFEFLFLGSSLLFVLL
jgi:hypothetical protein